MEEEALLQAGAQRYERTDSRKAREMATNPEPFLPSMENLNY
jgi:hypothetical protein